MLRKHNRKGPSRTIAEYVYEDAIGRRAIAKVKGVKPKEKRFEKTDSLETIRKWQDDTRRQLRQQGRVRQNRDGTLLGDVLAYLEDLPAGKPRNNTRADLTAWCVVLGSRPRASITVKDLRAVIKGWIERGDAASTIKKRRRALAQLEETLDGDDDDDPPESRARRVKAPAEPKPAPRGVPMDVLDAIILGMDITQTPHGRGGRMFRNRARARLRLFLWTGAGPETQRRLHPSAIDLDRGTITLPPRSKGEGAAGVTVRLFPEGIEAAREWLTSHAWGRFTTRALGRAFHAAVRRYVAAEAAAGRIVYLPPDLKPYDIRHSFLSWVWWQTKDPFLVQHFAQHADLETTKRYILSQVDAQAEAAIAAYSTRRALGTSAPVPTAPNGVPKKTPTPTDTSGPSRTERRSRLRESLWKS